MQHFSLLGKQHLCSASIYKPFKNLSCIKNHWLIFIRRPKITQLYHAWNKPLELHLSKPWSSVLKSPTLWTTNTAMLSAVNIVLVVYCVKGTLNNTISCFACLSLLRVPGVQDPWSSDPKVLWGCKAKQSKYWSWKACLTWGKDKVRRPHADQLFKY